MDEGKSRILEATISVFNKKGLKFTMDDIALEISISKKTIYKTFENKEELLYEMVDYCFDRIKESEAAIFQNDQMTTLEKIREILVVLPDCYQDVDFRQLYSLNDKFPAIYEKVQERLETGWEGTMELLSRGVEEGVIRPINLAVFKIMFESTLEQFFQRDVLLVNEITYSEALNEVLTILLDGCVVRK